MKANFDKVASVYDFLAKMVFGTSIRDAQFSFLNALPNGSRVLVLGGGSGFIIPEICAIVKPSEFVFLDNSPKMLAKAASYIPASFKERVKLVEADAFQFASISQCDCIISPFFLDLFNAREQAILIAKYSQLLDDKGLWLHIDFVTQPKYWWQLVLLTSMRLFFNMVCKTKLATLNDTSQLFIDYDFSLQGERFYYQKMIFSRAFRKK